MCGEQKFFVCERCGNLVGMIKNAGVKMMCCGKPMNELIANTADASTEKHIPLATINNNLVTIEVGSVPHPMTEEHYIGWVYILTEQGGQRKCIKLNESPVVTFALTEDDKLIEVYSYCNLHGLWKYSVK